MKNDIKISEEKLEEFEKQTKNEFTKLLLNNLKRRLWSLRKISFSEELDFERIVNLIEKEKNNKILRDTKTINNTKLIFTLKISKVCSKKIKVMNIRGENLISNLSKLIQKEFNLEPFHLYEFQIGKFKFGPECDEWQEIFDSLDNISLNSAILAAKLSRGDIFYFIYDFGENIKFKIEIFEAVKNGK